MKKILTSILLVFCFFAIIPPMDARADDVIDSRECNRNDSPDFRHWTCDVPGYTVFDIATSGSPLCVCLKTGSDTSYGVPTLEPDTTGHALATPEPKHEPFEPIRCGGGISTALGCIPIGDPSAFAGWFLRLALGISGGIAFLLMIFAGFQIMTSSGNPDKIQGGKELLNAAISGLVLIIFSIFLLKLIGVDILGLPNFGA